MKDAYISASYLDLQLEIDSERRILPKEDDYNFPILNFPLISSSIRAATLKYYGIFISQLIRNSRACGSYRDFLDKRMLLTRKQLTQGFILVELNSSLRKNDGRYHGLVKCYGIAVSHMTTNMVYLSYTLSASPRSWLITGFVSIIIWPVAVVEQDLLTLLEHMSSLTVFSGVRGFYL